MTQPIRSEVVSANIAVHSRLADVYDQTEPHFRPENQAKVAARLQRLARSTKARRMLDLGCGTGFMLSLGADLFDCLDGIDATRSMLDRVDRSSGKITLHEDVVEALPFESNVFDVVTAYSFLDHLEDPLVVLREAHRVLVPSGILYVDLIPNRSFWSRIYEAEQRVVPGTFLDPIVVREVDELVRHEEKLERTYGIRPEDWRLAEPAKSELKGFDPVDLAHQVSGLGFTDVEVRHEWFLGQAPVMHDTSNEMADAIDAHLRRLLPASEGLFKYLVLTARKP